ncbi:bifunctional folylpolyglutamate synthase/dihydrofolate synthase, partial [Ruminococcaceae bacterium OttesenSCG-928-L11]|nr:bifunctional folylpolyglutamate synthase/dihydrofolate synthase [Ruminococcaceae bacterium OttesenSCG-928-L11]
VVVLEVGMGGQTDSTNVITNPLVSVITSISIDHTKYLGETIEKIAREKCGIIKRGGVTVCYPRQDTEALAVIMERCAEEENRLLIPGNPIVYGMGVDGSDIEYDGVRIHIPLVGEHQIYNATTALETVRALETTSLQVTMTHAQRGIAQTTFASRFEKIGEAPVILLDGAHNPSGAEMLGKALELLGGKPIHAVMAMMEDKDVKACIRQILPRVTSLTATTLPEFPRALSADKLADMAREFIGDITVAENPSAAFAKALERCGKEGVLLVCGSFYLTSQLRPTAQERAGIHPEYEVQI